MNQEVIEHTDTRLVITAIIISIAVFVMDLNVQLGVASGVPYVAVVLLGMWSSRHFFSVMAAVSSSTLILAGFYLSPPGGILWIVLANRFLAILGVWVAAAVCYQYKRTDLKLREEHVRTNAILNTAVDGIITISETGMISMFNPGSEKIFGYSQQEVLMKDIGILMSDPYANNVEHYISKYLRTGEKKIIGNRREVSARRKDGTVFPLDLSVSEVQLSKQRIFTASVRDITQQKLAQSQMLQAGKMAAIGELAGNVAHEINNPIGIISAKARLLLSNHAEGMSEKTVEELGKVIHLADRVAQIAHGLLSYCRQSAARKTKMFIQGPIGQALDIVKDRAAKAEVEIEVHYAESLPAIFGNSNEIEQVFLNLFINALDAMPKSGQLKINAKVESDPPPSDKTLVITVENTGTPISNSLQDRIFEPFFTTKEEGQGTGLGLSICQGLIKSHNGSIQVDSSSDHGVRFTIILPVESAVEEKGDR